MKQTLLLCLLCVWGVNAQQPNNEYERFPVTANASPYVRQVDDSIVCYSYNVGRIFYHVCNYTLNGAPCYTETFIAGFDNDNIYLNGPKMSFFPNGKPEKACNYLYGCLYGSYAEWYANGKLKTRGEYWLDIDDNSVRLNHFKGDTTITIDPITFEEKMEVVVRNPLELKNGLWQYFDSTGVLVNQELWDKGVLVE